MLAVDVNLLPVRCFFLRIQKTVPLIYLLGDPNRFSFVCTEYGPDTIWITSSASNALFATVHFPSRCDGAMKLLFASSQLIGQAVSNLNLS
jgi:hypothetical protein